MSWNEGHEKPCLLPSKSFIIFPFTLRSSFFSEQVRVWAERWASGLTSSCHPCPDMGHSWDRLSARPARQSLLPRSREAPEVRTCCGFALPWGPAWEAFPRDTLSSLLRFVMSQETCRVRPPPVFFRVIFAFISCMHFILILNQLVKFSKNTCWNFYWDYTESYISLYKFLTSSPNTILLSPALVCFNW